MQIGVLTGGGDCAGLNAAIRAVVRVAGHQLNSSVIGYRRGWNGLLEGDSVILDSDAMRGTLPRGGTMLGTSRSSPRLLEEGTEPLLAQLERDGTEALVAIGGDGTLITASRLADAGFPVVGVPKTIDNDVFGTDTCIGFDTALGVATGAVDRLHTTAESHNRIMVLEVMGRDTGHIAAGAGIAGGAAAILVPEAPFSIDEVAERLIARHERNRDASIVVVAEGAMPDASAQAPNTGTDEWGHRIYEGMGQFVSELLAKRTGFDTRTTVLGHIQRGGAPSPRDRLLASRLGASAVELLIERQAGRMVGVQGTGISRPLLSEVAGRTRYLSEDQLSLLDLISTAPVLTAAGPDSGARRWF